MLGLTGIQVSLFQDQALRKINLDGIEVEVIPKRIKSMNLRIYPPDGIVKMSVPLRCSEKLIRQCLQDKLGWIIQQRERIKKIPKDQELKTGSTIQFKGKNYLLIVEEHHGPTHIEINDQLIHCYIETNSSPTQIMYVFDQWYRREMESALPALITHWESIIGVEVNQWGIKKMKTLWGSCNHRAARIWFNLNLIKKPMICLEYVIVHEMIHLLEPSHNKRFYALMNEFMPTWREYHLILDGKSSIKDEQ